MLIEILSLKRCYFPNNHLNKEYSYQTEYIFTTKTRFEISQGEGVIKNIVKNYDESIWSLDRQFEMYGITALKRCTNPVNN